MSDLSALFPGQGSQHPGMGRYLYDNFALVKDLFEEASDSVNLDFKKLCFEGSEADLALTENTQPCLLLVSTAAFQVLKTELGFAPKVAAGHSVGEYAAVVAAGALKFSDGIKAVKKRGRAMQEAVPVGEGGMAAVMGLTPEQVEKVCAWAQEETGLKPLEPANFNAPGQIVISGKLKLIHWAAENFTPQVLGQEKMRVKFIPLKVSAPFHCSMMKPAQDEMQAVLGAMEFKDPDFPVVQNVNAQVENVGEDLRKNLVAQVSSPVRWIGCMEALRDFGAPRMIECGSGQVLAGLGKKIDSTHLQIFNMNSLEELRALESVVNS